MQYGEKRAKKAMKKVRAQNNFKILPKNRAPVPGYSSSEYPGNEVVKKMSFALFAFEVEIIQLLRNFLTAKPIKLLF